ATCHDPKYLFADGRKNNNVSAGAGFTVHNALSLVNVGYKLQLAERDCPPDAAPTDVCRSVFSWNGQYQSAAGVLNLAGLGAAAMNSSKVRVAHVIRTKYAVDYMNAFGSPPPDGREY